MKIPINCDICSDYKSKLKECKVWGDISDMAKESKFPPFCTAFNSSSEKLYKENLKLKKIIERLKNESLC